MQSQVNLARIRLFWVKSLNIVVIVAALVVYGSWASKANAHDQLVREQMSAAERAASRGPYATDGTFEGTAQGYNGPVAMRVTIEDGYITSVTIADSGVEDSAFLDMCKDLPARMVREQTADVDAVSGATYTSTGIIDATRNALRLSAKGDQR